MSASPALPRRERLLVFTSLCGLALLAWTYTIYEARRMNTTGVCECMRMKMSGPELSSWPVATLLPLFLMWAIMMIAMMLPSALPMILTFAAQWWLHRHALLSASMASTSTWLGGILLVTSGIFQFTPLKQSCLTHCRGPLEFIMTRWREGRSGAFRMGLEHGAFCTGCCWALMALLFVAGVMNILWIAALTLLVCLEKMLPARAGVSFATGLLLCGWGAFILFRP
jgi:predicted metal-binding membrane protein